MQLGKVLMSFVQGICWKKSAQMLWAEMIAHKYKWGHKIRNYIKYTSISVSEATTFHSSCFFTKINTTVINVWFFYL